MNFDIVSILQAGAIGLGFLLAYLAYKLLSKEQDKENPRSSIITAIYMFMAFSIVLVILGGVFKSLPDWLGFANNSSSENAKKLAELSELQKKLHENEITIKNLNIENGRHVASKEEEIKNLNRKLEESDKQVVSLQKELSKTKVTQAPNQNRKTCKNDVAPYIKNLENLKQRIINTSTFSYQIVSLSDSFNELLAEAKGSIKEDSLKNIKPIENVNTDKNNLDIKVDRLHEILKSMACK